MMQEDMDTADDDADGLIFRPAANPMTVAEAAATEHIRELIGEDAMPITVDGRLIGEDAMTIKDGRLSGLKLENMPGLTALPELSGLVAFTTLSIRYCGGLTALPELSSLGALTTLEVNNCPGLTALPELSSLVALATLTITSCLGLTALPELSSLVSLKALNIYGCPATALPELSSLLALTKLEINNCPGSTALPELSSLVALETLQIFRCDDLTALPELSSLGALTTLKINDCSGLTALPELSSLVSLATIDIGRCPGLTVLPELSHLVALTTLKISGCFSLKALPELSRLVALADLKIYQCPCLMALPVLSSLGALERLEVYSCTGLTALPVLSSLVSLATLDVYSCIGLTALPELSGLVSLATLQIVRCEGLTALPEMSSLVALTDLKISSCDCLTALPISVAGLSSLKKLFVVGSRLTIPPQQLHGGGITEILRHIAATAFEEFVPRACLPADAAARLLALPAGHAWFFLHTITNPDLAEHLGHAVSADPSLAYLVSTLPASKGERAIDLAALECRRAMQIALHLLKRFAIDQGPPLHLSATAAVVAATDHHDQFSKPLPRRALKLMREADQVCAELLGRVGLDAKYVVPVTAVYVDASVKEKEQKKVESAATKLGLTLESVEGLTDRLGRELTQHSGSRSMWMGGLTCALPADGDIPAKKMRTSAVSVAQYTFLLVLHLADRTLSTALTHDYIAGHDFFAVRKIAHDLALALDHLHHYQIDNRRIHADVKPLNAVRVNSTWTLIDFDVSCKLGQGFGTKVPSSGHCPPEMALLLLKVAGGTSKLSEYLASVAYDLLSYGVLLFHLITGRSLFHTYQDDSISSTDLHELSAWSPASLNKRLADVAQVRSGEVKLAINLLRKLLESDPEKRLSHFQTGQEMRSVLQDPWFAQQLPDAVEPRSLLIVACSPTFSPLPHALSEADEVAALCSGVVEVKHGGTANDLRTLLARPTRRWLFAGHADGPSPGGDTSLPKTLGFTLPDGGLEVVRPEDLATIMGLATPSRGGCLELVVLNGCCSEALGRAAHNAGVRRVVCWKTKVEDSAARIFTLAFFTALEDRRSIADAFDEAKVAAMCDTRPGTIAGLTALVPKFELRCPGTASAMASVFPVPWAAGIPVLID